MFQLDLVVRNTWGPESETPILRSKSSGKRVNVFTALVFEPEIHVVGLWFSLQTVTFNGDIIAELLAELIQEIPGDWTLILDNWSVHRRAIRLLDDRDDFHILTDENNEQDDEEPDHSTATTLAVEWSPTYAPDLNPVEDVWSHVKYGELANFTPLDQATLKTHVERLVAAKQDRSQLLQDYIRNAELEFL